MSLLGTSAGLACWPAKEGRLGDAFQSQDGRHYLDRRRARFVRCVRAAIEALHRFASTPGNGRSSADHTHPVVGATPDPVGLEFVEERASRAATLCSRGTW